MSTEDENRWPCRWCGSEACPEPAICGALTLIPVDLCKPTLAHNLWQLRQGMRNLGVTMWNTLTARPLTLVAEPCPGCGLTWTPDV